MSTIPERKPLEAYPKILKPYIAIACYKICLTYYSECECQEAKEGIVCKYIMDQAWEESFDEK